MMKKLFISLIFMFLLVIFVNSVDAAGNIDITAVSNITSKPGVTATTNVTVNNSAAGTTIATVNLVSTDLTRVGGSDTITAPTIANIATLVGGTQQLKSFTISVPYTLAGVYRGTINASNTTSSDTKQYQVTVSSVYGLNVVDTSVILSGQEKQTKTGAFTIKNTGSIALSFASSSVVYSPANFKDNDNKNISLAFSSIPTTLNPGATDSIIISATISDNMDLGTYTGTINVTSTSSSAANDTFGLQIKIQPEVCRYNETGKLTVRIDEPDTGDKYKPGETLELEVDVENDYNDELDVVVEAFLYNINEDDVVVEEESESIEIGDDDTETFYLDLILPTTDMDEGDEYILYVKAYEDGDEDDHCDEASITINIDLDKHEVIVDSVTLTPSTVAPGESFTASVKVVNIGTTDEDDVIINLVESDLDLDLYSVEFEVDKFSKKDNDAVRRFTFTVPADTKEGTYSIEAVAEYDGGDESDSAFATLTVKGESVVVITPSETAVSIEIVTLPSEIEAGKSYSIPVKVTNNKVTTQTFTVSLDNVDDWAESVTDKTLTLEPGQSETVYFYVKAKSDLAEGKHTATANVKSGTSTVATKTVTLSTEAEEKKLFDVEGTNVFWIIGYIVLVIIAIFFIRLIFTSGRRRKIQEVKL